MAKSPEDAIQSMIDGLEAKTGKSLAAWLAVVKKTRLAKHGEIVAALKAEHGIGHGFANLIAHQALGSDSMSATAQGVDLVAQQYAGAKATLRPIYDALVADMRRFGPDVEVSPKKGYVSLRRAKQFALIQPSTATRLDVGLNLKAVAPTARLEASGSFNAMCTHRVRVTSVDDVDKELLGWLKEAYRSA